MPRAIKDILAGLTFVAFGLAFSVLALGYQVGTPVRMGPGFFPLVLGVLLAIIGAVVAVKGFLANEGEAIGIVPWRALGLIVAAVLFFGLTVRGLGLIPSTFFAALMATFASRRTGVVAAVLITVGLTVLCFLIFVLALRLRLPLIGPWIPV
jgi:hypothetical protein